MTDRLVYIVLVIGSIPCLTFFFFHFDPQFPEDKTFLSISTFLFSIFTGFFISRQASRFNRIRENVTNFDSKLSGIYRLSGHFGEEMQKQIGTTIKAHYKKIFDTKAWHIHYTQKSATITKLHKILDDTVVEDEVSKLKNQALGTIVKNLAACQDVRKQVIALMEERIPKEQWLLIIFFGAMLIGTASSIDSNGAAFPSLLKAAFVVSVISVLYILFKLNNLDYSEEIMGQHSAEDVVNIIKKVK